MKSLLLLTLFVLSQHQKTLAQGDGDVQEPPTPAPTSAPTPYPTPSPPVAPEPEPLVDFVLTNRKVGKLSYEKNKDDWIAAFDNYCKTVYIIPGYLTGRLTLYDEMTAAYLALTDCYNIVFCQWPSSFDPDYIHAAQSTYDVGDAIGQHILDLNGKGVLVGSIDVVGHGLGAHVAGCAGKTTSSALPLDGITALDPIGELFTDGYPAFEDFRIQPTDANRVVCLHTSSIGMGAANECGKHNFYANNGVKQPGIIFEYRGYYSHLASLHYFIESIGSDGFVAHGPLGFPTTRFSSKIPKNTPAGKYYFKTNTKPPYARN